MDISALNDQFAIDDQIIFEQKNDDTLQLNINTAKCTAAIVMQGAHLIHWQPKNTAQPVIWLSQDASFKKQKSIRGGIPVCWPWFGDHEKRRSNDRLREVRDSRPGAEPKKDGGNDSVAAGSKESNKEGQDAAQENAGSIKQTIHI